MDVATLVTSGWSGLGITGLLLGWLLLKHLPSKDAQIDAMIKSRDDIVKNISDINKSALSELALSHRSAVSDIVDKIMVNDKERKESQERMLSMVIEHCRDENKSRDDRLELSLDQITKAATDTREVLEELRDSILRLVPYSKDSKKT